MGKPRQSAIKELFESQSPYFKAELLPIQEDLKRAAQAKRRDLAGLKAKGRLTREAVVQAQYDLSEAYHLAQERVRQEIDGEFARAEKKWRSARNPTEESLALQRYQLRYGAMSKDEISDEIERYCASPAGWAPDQVDSLHAAAARVGSEVLGVLRSTMKRVNYSEPWKAERPDLLRLRELHDAPFGQARILGPLGEDDYDIAGLLDATGDEE